MAARSVTERLEIARRWVNPALTGVFEAEIRNEDNGGVRPATLSSTIDSLSQMPDDIMGDMTDGENEWALMALVVIRDLLPGNTPVALLLERDEPDVHERLRQRFAEYDDTLATPGQARDVADQDLIDDVRKIAEEGA